MTLEPQPELIEQTENFLEQSRQTATISLVQISQSDSDSDNDSEIENHEDEVTMNVDTEDVANDDTTQTEDQHCDQEKISSNDNTTETNAETIEISDSDDVDESAGQDQDSVVLVDCDDTDQVATKESERNKPHTFKNLKITDSNCDTSVIVLDSPANSPGNSF